MTVLTRMLIASEFRKEKDSEEFLSVIKNPLFKYGVNSSCLELLGKSKNIDSILKDFTQVRLN